MLTENWFALPSTLCDCYAGSTFTCTDALVISAAGSNVRFDIDSITLTGGATLGTCTPAITLPTTTAPLGPTPAASTSIVCSVRNPTIVQTDVEAGFIAWDVTVGSVVAKGSNNSLNGPYTVTFNKTLPQVRKYTLGIKRVAVDASDTLQSVVTAGECLQEWQQWLVAGHRRLCVNTVCAADSVTNHKCLVLPSGEGA